MLKTGAVVLSVLGFLQQYYGHGSSCSAKDPNGIPEGPHMQSMHSWFGIIILGAYWIQGPSALAIFTNTKLLKPGTHWRMERDATTYSLGTSLSSAVCLRFIREYSPPLGSWHPIHTPHRRLPHSGGR